MTDLELQYSKLKEERTEFYRTQSLNAQKLLDMNDQLKTKEGMIGKLEGELRIASETKKVLDRKIQDNALLIEEKNLNIQVSV